ncbi:hypothetical protein DXG01_002397 [Tephrocybe rancida]|nr:hypothetical protein DXG01_002397 [Tephrocybe rancida]
MATIDTEAPTNKQETNPAASAIEENPEKRAKAPFEDIDKMGEQSTLDRLNRCACSGENVHKIKKEPTNLGAKRIRHTFLGYIEHLKDTMKDAKDSLFFGFKPRKLSKAKPRRKGVYTLLYGGRVDTNIFYDYME